MTMIERVARAMLWRRITDLGIYPEGDGRIEEAIENGWELWCAREAEAAIEAMREPTDAMLQAMEVEIFEHAATAAPWQLEACKGGWIAAIEAELGERA
jgi:hypothetical protein